MRILFLYLFPLWGNGSGSFLRELTLVLQKRGHIIAIVSPDKRKLDGITHFYVPPPNTGVFVGHPELPGAKKMEEMSSIELLDLYNKYLTTTIEAVKAFNPDLIHVFHTAFLPEVARVIKAFYRIRYIITTHGSDLSYLVRDRRLIPLIQDANRQARFIVAVSDFTKDWYLDIFGHELFKKVIVIEGGVDIGKFKKDKVLLAEINKKYHLLGKKVVLFTGRLTNHKGVLYLIRAAKAIKGTILVVGDGPERAVLEKEIKDKNIKNVVMVGYVNNTDPLFHAFYERADVYVSPSVWDEPLGLTILEAMASSTPVVATRKGGILSLIDDRRTGLLIRPRNSQEIAFNVNMLLEADEIRKKIGEEAHKTVLEKFTWEKIATRFEKLYDQMKTKEKLDAGPLDKLVQKMIGK